MSVLEVGEILCKQNKMQWECAAWNFLSTGIFIFLKKSKFLNKKLSKKKNFIYSL